jgi:hypothetical protein
MKAESKTQKNNQRMNEMEIWWKGNIRPIPCEIWGLLSTPDDTISRGRAIQEDEDEAVAQPVAINK